MKSLSRCDSKPVAKLCASSRSEAKRKRWNPESTRNDQKDLGNEASGVGGPSIFKPIVKTKNFWDAK